MDKQVFLWLAVVATLVILFVPLWFIYAPIASAGWGYIAVSGTLEAVYFALLGSAYQRGDMSLVYPLARGSAPVFVILLALLFLGERVFLGGIAGIALIVTGIYVLHLKSLDRRGLAAPFLSLKERPSQLALLTGLTIAGYNVVDKVGVRYASPVLYLYMDFLVAAALLAPYMVIARSEAIRREWRANKTSIVAVAIMFIASFTLVLMALTRDKVSYVAPVREVSVVFGALLGTLVLKEPFGKAKLAGSALIFVGIVCIGLVR